MKDRSNQAKVMAALLATFGANSAVAQDMTFEECVQLVGNQVGTDLATRIVADMLILDSFESGDVEQANSSMYAFSDLAMERPDVYNQIWNSPEGQNCLDQHTSIRDIRLLELFGFWPAVATAEAGLDQQSYLAAQLYIAAGEHSQASDLVVEHLQNVTESASHYLESSRTSEGASFFGSEVSGLVGEALSRAEPHVERRYAPQKILRHRKK